MQNKETLFHRLATVAYVLIISSSLVMIGCSLSGPQYGLPRLRMAVGSVFCAVLICVGFFVWNKFSACQEKLARYMFVGAAIGFGLLLLYVCFFCRNRATLQGDYDMMWQMASDIVRGRELNDYDYLNYYSNNFKPMLFLAGIFKVADMLQLKDAYYAVVLVSVIEVMGTVWAVSYLAEKREDTKPLGLPILLCFMFFLPVWGNTQAFYTDAMSFGLIVIALALAKAGCFRQGYRKYVYIVFAGIVAAVGLSLKITLMIPLIGFAIAVVVTQKIKKDRAAGICFVFAILGAYLLIEGWTCTYDAYVMSKEVSDPIISWIAIGLQGNGSYADNVPFVQQVHSFATKSEKTAYIAEVIAENKSNFFSISHWIDKIRTIYADGTFGAGVFAAEYEEKPNLVWNAFSTYGKYFWWTVQLCFVYIHGIYIIILFGQIRTLVNIVRGEMPSLMCMFTDLTMLGVFLFMGLWEANNRQLYNQIPLVMLGLILHLKAMTKTGLPPFIQKATCNRQQKMRY